MYGDFRRNEKAKTAWGQKIELTGSYPMRPFPLGVPQKLPMENVLQILSCYITLNAEYHCLLQLTPEQIFKTLYVR